MKRPDGWDELYLEAYREEYSGRMKYCSPERGMFDAGADAYEGELKKRALLKTKDGKIDLSFLNGITSNKEGYLVFIQED